MSNKTCVGCRYLGNAKETGLCEKRQICLYPEELPACKNFEEKKPTNGDVIRQGGNRALAEFQQLNTCDNCIYNNDSGVHEYCDKPIDKTCTDGIEAWLNAPACVAENGESAKQTDLCCKVDTESEGKDE